MDQVRIDSAIYRSMLKLARAKSPIEACAVLGGAEGRVSEFIEMTNADNSPEHFSFVPEEQFAAVKKLRAAGKKMIGIWHSHPASPARMSEEDLRLAYTPDVAYVILSLVDTDRPVLKAFNVIEGKPREIRLDIGEEDE